MTRDPSVPASDVGSASRPPRRAEVVLASSLLLALGFALGWIWLSLRADWQKPGVRESGLQILLIASVAGFVGSFAILNVMAGALGLLQRRSFFLPILICALDFSVDLLWPFGSASIHWARFGLMLGCASCGVAFYLARHPGRRAPLPLRALLSLLMAAGFATIPAAFLLESLNEKREAERKAAMEAAETKARLERIERSRRQEEEDDRKERARQEALRGQRLTYLYLDDGRVLGVAELMDPGPSSAELLCTLPSGEKCTLSKAAIVERVVRDSGSPPILSLKQQWRVFEKKLAEAVREDLPEDKRRAIWAGVAGQDLRLMVRVLAIRPLDGGRVLIEWESLQPYAVDVSRRPPGPRTLSGTAEGNVAGIPEMKVGGMASVVLRAGPGIGTLEPGGRIE